MKLNIAIAGAPCTGKSTLASMLFAKVKVMGWDYDLIFEEYRKLKNELGACRNPFDRFYLWRQQEREEKRSTATDGFITDSPLFHYYVQAKLYAQEPRDMLAVRELFRMCLEIEDRYQIIVIAQNPEELPYKTDGSRQASMDSALEKHRLILTFVDHFWHDKILLVTGKLEDRVQQVIDCIANRRGDNTSHQKQESCGSI